MNSICSLLTSIIFYLRNLNKYFPAPVLRTIKYYRATRIISPMEFLCWGAFSVRASKFKKQPFSSNQMYTLTQGRYIHKKYQTRTQEIYRIGQQRKVVFEQLSSQPCVDFLNRLPLLLYDAPTLKRLKTCLRSFFSFLIILKCWWWISFRNPSTG